MIKNRFSVITSNKSIYYISFIVLNLFIIFLSMLASVIITGSRGGAGFGLPIGIVISYLIMCVVSGYTLLRIIIQSIIYLIISLSIFSVRFSYIPQIESHSIIFNIVELVIGLILSSFLSDFLYYKLTKTGLFNKIRNTKTENIED